MLTHAVKYDIVLGVQESAKKSRIYILYLRNINILCVNDIPEKFSGFFYTKSLIFGKQEVFFKVDSTVFHNF